MAECGRLGVFGMTITQLEYFLQIGERLNVSKAAQELFVSQSVLSRQITSLERELGVELFVRGRRGLSFTPAGQIFYSALKPQAREFKTLLSRISSLGNAGELRISFGLPSFGTLQPKQKLVIDILRGPECGAALSIVSKGPEELFSMLMDRELDLVTLPQAGAEENREQLAFFPLTESQMYLIYSSEASGVKPEPDSLRDFSDVTLTAYLPRQREMLTELCRKNGFVPKCEPIRDEEIVSSITIQGKAFLGPEWMILRAGHMYDSYLLADYPKEVDVLAWRKDNLNPAISIIEAKRSLLRLPEQTQEDAWATGI